MKKEYRPVTGFLLALFGLVLTFIGLYRQEAQTVFEKAIRICLECIGIG